MIRRDVRREGRGDGWLLISQVVHAELAGELAAVWSTTEHAPLVDRAQLAPAITHHDDGWAEWERMPGLDRDGGFPLAFTEMPIAESVEIWQRSIDMCAHFGPLAGATVSRHFQILGQHAQSHHAAGPERASVDAFLERQSRQSQSWLAEWRSASHDPQAASAAAADLALEQLRFFDYFSLWLCMAERHEPADLPAPAGNSLHLVPQVTARQSSTDMDGSQGPQPIGVQPWPFAARRLELAVSGRWLPARKYASAAELWLAADPSESLAWVLEPVRL